jgi:molybdopterin-guanine dinucleotide biosynthesis protein A
MRIMAECAGAILAGGKSSRMGADKAHLRINNQTLLQHMEHILRAAQIENIYVSRADVVADVFDACGPLGGIHAILTRVLKQHTHIVFVPVDMPGLHAGLINKLVSAPSDADLVHFKSHKIPFRISADARWVQKAQSLLECAEDVSLGSFQASILNHLHIEITPDEQACFENINNPQQWDHYVKSHEKIKG